MTASPPPTPNPLEPPAPELARRALAPIYRRGDQLMTLFLGAHALIGLLLASWYDTWRATLVVGGCALGLFHACRAFAPGSFATRWAAGVALQMFVILHIHQLRGLFEMHFWFFTASTMLVVYRDWHCLLPGALLIVAHHAAFDHFHAHLGWGDGTAETAAFFDPARQVWHYAVVAIQTAVCGAWAEQLRRQAVHNAAREQELGLARDQALAASRAKGAFLADLSHELRSPIAAVAGLATLMGEQHGSGPGPSRLRDDLDAIRRHCDHLLALVNDVLDLSKIEQQKLTLERLVASPQALVRDAVELVRPAALAKRIAVEVRWEVGPPPAILTDPTRLKQVLINLLSNAVKFTERGPVELVVGPDGPGRLRFAVRDQGIGIAPADLDRLFLPYEQADPSVARRHGGTGLGLAISRRLAEMLGGSLTAESEPGAGSRFTLTIAAPPAPQSDSDPIPAPTRATAPRSAVEPAPSRPPLRALLAEDTPDLRRILGHFLSPIAEVHAVIDGQQALEAALQARDDGRPFDIVVMDICMPRMDGYEATRRMRKAGMSTPVLALTAFAVTEERSRCLAAGCDDYLSKPVRPDVLVNKVRAMIAGVSGPCEAHPIA